MSDIIAIDGPASVGKSSLAKKVSKNYNSPILHSGRLYRAVALEIKNQRININDKKNIIKIAKSLTSENLKSKNLFSTDIDMISSQISARKYLRDALKTYQKKFAIVEGRDIGTEIFPEAKFKIFMWADAKIRAKRRYEQILKKGQKASIRRIYNEIITRDAKDLKRKIAPLMPAVNSVLLDTTYLDIEQAFNAIKKLLDQ